MNQIKFRAIIKSKDHENITNHVYFDLMDLIKNPLDGVDELLLIPWLKEGNMPDRWTGEQDIEEDDIYENDLVHVAEYCIGDKIIPAHDGIVKFSLGEFYVGSTYGKPFSYVSDNFKECIINNRLTIKGKG